MKQFNVNIRYESSNKISYRRAKKMFLIPLKEFPITCNTRKKEKEKKRKKEKSSRHKYEKEIKGDEFRSSSETGVNSVQTIGSAEK